MDAVNPTGPVSEEYVLAQAVAHLRFPGSKLIAGDAGSERDPKEEDPGYRLSAYSRSWLSAPAPVDSVRGWLRGRLLGSGWAPTSAADDPRHLADAFARGARERLLLFYYLRPPFRREGQGMPPPSAFTPGVTVYQTFYEILPASGRAFA